MFDVRIPHSWLCDFKQIIEPLGGGFIIVITTTFIIIIISATQTSASPTFRYILDYLGSGVGLGVCISNRLPSNGHDASLLVTL